MALEQLQFSIRSEWSQFAQEHPSGFFIPECAQDSKGAKFMRRRGSSTIYRVVNEDSEGNQEYSCVSCGSQILGARVAHAIWDGPFPCSGSGECKYETVPYCPKCEKEPNFHGTPITIENSLL